MTWQKAMRSWRSKREKLVECWSKSFRDVAHSASLVGRSAWTNVCKEWFKWSSPFLQAELWISWPPEASFRSERNQFTNTATLITVFAVPSCPLNLSGWCSGAAAAPTAAPQSSSCKAKHWQPETLLRLGVTCASPPSAACVLPSKTKCSKAFQATGSLAGWQNFYTSSGEKEKAMYFQGSKSCEFESCLKGMRTKGRPPAPAGSWHCPKTICAKTCGKERFIYSMY